MSPSMLTMSGLADVTRIRRGSVVGGESEALSPGKSQYQVESETAVYFRTESCLQVYLP